jgi:carbonic anhydrase
MPQHKMKLAQNIAWANNVNARDPDFFRRIAEGQQPDMLWIGCADSRVPAEEIINAPLENSSSIATSRTSSGQMTSMRLASSNMP